MKLTEEKQEAIREWLNNDVDRTGQPVHWTLKRLCLEVKSVFSVDISIAAMGSTLKKMGMAQKRPRPMHYFHNRLHDSIEDVKISIERALASFMPQTVASICSCSYLCEC